MYISWISFTYRWCCPPVSTNLTPNLIHKLIKLCSLLLTAWPIFHSANHENIHSFTVWYFTKHYHFNKLLNHRHQQIKTDAMLRYQTKWDFWTHTTGGNGFNPLSNPFIIPDEDFCKNKFLKEIFLRRVGIGYSLTLHGRQGFQDDIDTPVCYLILPRNVLDNCYSYTLYLSLLHLHLSNIEL